VQSELKKFDAGQFGATIVAEVAADRAGPLLDRIKQLGKVARLEVQRKQTNSESGAPTRVERKDTRFNLSIYNLANVAPRITTTLALAADDAEATYRAVLARVQKAGGRIISSNLSRPKNEQITGTIGFELPADQSDAITVELKSAGEVMSVAVAENPDTANTTTAKRGFSLQILAVAGIAPRETTSVSLAATNVSDARNKILDAARTAGARVLGAQLNESDQQNVSATLDLDIKRDTLPDLDKALLATGDVLSRTVNRAADTENTIDTKLRLTVSLVGIEKIPPRQSTTLGIEVSNVESALADVQSTASTSGGKVTQSNLSKDRQGRTVGKVVVDVAGDKADDLITHAKGLGTVRVFDSARNPQAPEGKLARARIEITFGNAEAIVAPGQGVWSSVRNALATSAAGLLWSLQIVIIGLCFVLPWALLLWAGWKFARRRKTVEAPA
jgi:hypothetical protein